MTSQQLALWEPEPCHTAAPAPRPRTSADRDWTDDELAEWLHSRGPTLSIGAGRPAGRTGWRGLGFRRIANVTAPEEYL